MISRYEAWLNDIPLSEIAPSIYVSDISYQAAKVIMQNMPIANDGAYSGEKTRIENNKITVSFAVREYDTGRRQEVVQNVILWASNGGWLKTSDRSGQKIFVKPTAFPGVSSVMRWVDDLAVEFTAFDFPFWVDEYPKTLILSSGENGELFLPGVRKTFVELNITANGALTEIEVDCGDTIMLLTGLSIVAGDVVTVSYTDDHHILEIKSGNVSLLDKRASASDDDLIADVGWNNISFAADGSAVCTVSVRGVYL